MSAWSLSILAFGFLSPLLMGAGAAATSIPIIIHLLNKRKFKVVFVGLRVLRVFVLEFALG